MSGDKKYCSKCGATMVDGAAYCSSCGAAVVSADTHYAPRREYRREKEEKNEKNEKHEKGEKTEKGGGRTGPFLGGMILIWLGLSFYLAQTTVIPWASWWAYFLTGLGVIIIVHALIRYSRSEYRYPLTGSFVGGAIISIIGLAFLAGMSDFWPIVLIIIGIAIIVSAVTARRRAPNL